MTIGRHTGLEELAVLVSTALAKAGISATLSGGAAVSIYSDNAYQSLDLDFVTGEGKRRLREAIAPLGFEVRGGSRLFEHPETDWLVEFPPGPLGFGNLWIDAETLPTLDTPYGPLRIITPTLSVMDRLAAYWYHRDRQCWDQAIEVAKRQDVDWRQLREWAEGERRGSDDIDRLRNVSREARPPKRLGTLNEFLSEDERRALDEVIDAPLSDRDRRILAGEGTDELGIWKGLPEERDGGSPELPHRGRGDGPERRDESEEP